MVTKELGRASQYVRYRLEYGTPQEGAAMTPPWRRDLVTWAHLNGHLDKLSPQQFHVILYRYFDEPSLGVDKTAHALGIPSPTVSILESYAIKNFIMQKMGGREELVNKAKESGAWSYLTPLEHVVLERMKEGKKPRPLKIAKELDLKSGDQVAKIEGRAMEKIYILLWQNPDMKRK